MKTLQNSPVAEPVEEPPVSSGIHLWRISGEFQGDSSGGHQDKFVFTNWNDVAPDPRLTLDAGQSWRRIHSIDYLGGADGDIRSNTGIEAPDVYDFSSQMNLISSRSANAERVFCKTLAMLVLWGERSSSLEERISELEYDAKQQIIRIGGTSNPQCDRLCRYMISEMEEKDREMLIYARRESDDTVALIWEHVVPSKYEVGESIQWPWGSLRIVRSVSAANILN